MHLQIGRKWFFPLQLSAFYSYFLLSTGFSMMLNRSVEWGLLYLFPVLEIKYSSFYLTIIWVWFVFILFCFSFFYFLFPAFFWIMWTLFSILFYLLCHWLYLFFFFPYGYCDYNVPIYLGTNSLLFQLKCRSCSTIRPYTPFFFVLIVLCTIPALTENLYYTTLKFYFNH